MQPCFALLLMAALGGRAAAAQRPNILFLFADDQRADTIAAHGNPRIKTPHLDRLVSGGFSFRGNYIFGGNSGAVCMPSRAMLMSGKSWFRVDTVSLKGAKLLPELLGENGYVTFGTGKWHNGQPSWLRAFQRGKNVFFGGMSDHEKVPIRDLGPDGTLTEARIGEKFSSELFADAAIEFLRNHDGKKPFFVYVAFTAPHDPRSPPLPYREAYYRDLPPLPANFLPQFPFDNGMMKGGRDENLAPWPRTEAVIRDQLAEYYGLITHMDEQVGRILAALDQTGQADNTLVVYTADNGLALGSHGLLGKQSVFEHSMKVPLIFAGRGIPRGKSTAAFTYLLDVFPTLCDVSGIEPPPGLEGESLRPLWEGKKDRVRDSVFLPLLQIQRAVRDDRWKLICYPKIGHMQLFDLQSDPDERTNRIDHPECAQHVQRLLKLLRAWQAKVGDTLQLPTENQPPEKVDLTGRPREPDPWQPEWIRKKYFDAPGSAGARRPNMVVFLTDDHSAGDSTVYGAPGAPTPNMQRLAQAGLAFDRAFVASPSCAPSRAALLTGLMPARNGAMANHSRPRAALKKLPAYLQELGYEVVAFGKVSHYRHTKDYGFDHFAHDGFHDDEAVPAALRWLGERRGGKPLALFVGTNWPHVPWPDPPQDFDPAQVKPPPTFVDTPATREALARYFAAVSRMDSELGQVFDAAMQRLGPNTLFLTTSDNGAQFPFGKWNLYDAGTRTPLIAVWPGVIRPGTRTDAMVSWVDILPTLVELAGGSAPADLDGRSFAAVLLGKSSAHRELIFTTHSRDGDMNVYPCRAVRSAAWKYIRNLRPEARHTTHIDKAQAGDGKAYWDSWVARAATDPAAALTVQRYFTRPAEELYDLRVDPLEQHNLAADSRYAGSLASLRAALDGWMTAQGDEGLRTEETMGGVSPKAAKPPNVVVILADDLGYGDLGCYGREDVRTPALDGLAAAGVRFTQCYANGPECTPTRAALLTGRYQQRVGGLECALGTGNVGRYDDAIRLRQTGDLGLPVEETSIARMVQLAGYATGIVGKWHLGYEPKFSPNRNGFDHAFYALGGGMDYFHHVEPGGEHVLRLNGQPEHRHGYFTDLVSDEAVQFIARHAAAPFFLYVAYTAPHSPFQGPEDRLPEPLPADSPRYHQGRAPTKTYCAMIERMDAGIGRILSTLDRQGQADNTVVIFTSDNGGTRSARNAPFSGHKGSTWEGGIRVPAIVRWPRMLPAGQTCDQVCITMDFSRSIVRLAGAKPPAGRAFDGIDILDHVASGRAPVPRTLFWRGRRGDRTWWAVRDGSLKYIRQADGVEVREFLFDLSRDPAESVDLAASRAADLKRLRDRLAQWEQTVKPVR